MIDPNKISNKAQASAAKVTDVAVRATLAVGMAAGAACWGVMKQAWQTTQKVITDHPASQKAMAAFNDDPESG